MAKKWSYASAQNMKLGPMNCFVCGKKISTGLYRYREKPECYVVQHRACVPDDPQWARIDAENAQYQKRNQEMLADCIALRDKWQISDLDELIDALS